MRICVENESKILLLEFVENMVKRMKKKLEPYINTIMYFLQQ